MTNPIKMDQLVQDVNDNADWFERYGVQVRAVPVNEVYSIVANEVARGAAAGAARARDIVATTPLDAA